MRENYAMYLRKSQADIELEKMEQFETLSKHEKLLRALADKQNLNVTKVYKEIVSGESIEARPEIQKLLEEVEQEKYKGVLVVDIDRLARGRTRDQGVIMDAFQMSNTLIVTLEQTYDPNKESDEDRLDMELFFGRYEYKMITRRMKRGYEVSLNDGNYLGSFVPYGYEKYHKDRKTKTLKIVEDEAEIIRKIYHWYVYDDDNMSTIAKRLTTMGIAPPRKRWTPQTVKDILSNPTYIGKIRWQGRKRTIKYIDGKRKKTDVSQPPIIIQGKHQSIIDNDLFEKAQQKFSHPPIKLDKQLRNPFSGLLRCKHCNYMMALVVDKKRVPESWRFVHRYSSSCSVKSADYNVIVDLVVNTLKENISEFELKANKSNNSIDVLKEHEQTIQLMKIELDKKKQKRNSLFDYFEREIYTEEEFIERKQILNSEIAAAEKLLKETEAKKPKVIDYRERIYQISQAIEMLKDDNISAKDKNNFLKTFIEKISYDRENIKGSGNGEITLEIYFK